MKNKTPEENEKNMIEEYGYIDIDNQDDKNPKNDGNNFFKNNKNTIIIISVIILAILGSIIISKSRENKEKKYTYNDFILDLQDEKIQKVRTETGSRTVQILLKDEETIKEEKALRKKLEDEKDEAKKAKIKEDIKKYREKKKAEFIDSENEQKNQASFSKLKLNNEDKKKEKNRTKTLVVPEIQTFSEFVQDKIKNGSDVIFEVTTPPIYLSIISGLFNLLPFILFAVLIYYTLKMQNFGSKNKFYDDEAKQESKIKFSDVAGLDEEKGELVEIVDFLKNPDKYSKMGAKIPKGVLLYGSPGTGKTLVVKAIAGESGVPFISMSGSEFVEMFAGLGASRVRKLFEQARKVAPCIIFIDEIDAIGTVRTNGGSGGDSENNQTLNQLLVEMDGFDSSDNIIVIAATNRPELLDQALLRPGRFDRHISIPKPDIIGREEILRLHAKNKPFAKDINFKELAGDTAGFTGADLANILNEAAIHATRHKRSEIIQEDIEEAIKKVTIGLEKQNRVVSKKDRKITAYHESGHAIVSRCLKTTEKVKEVSIISRGMAGGYTMYKTSEDKSYMSKTELMEKIISLFGGRAAEEIYINDISTGASNDLKVATNIAKEMIIGYGMSNKIGPVSMHFDDPNDLHFLGLDITKETGNEIKKVLVEGYKEAIKILKSQEDTIHDLSKVLMEKEKITGEEFEEIFERNQKDNKYLDSSYNGE